MKPNSIAIKTGTMLLSACFLVAGCSGKSTSSDSPDAKSTSKTPADVPGKTVEPEVPTRRPIDFDAASKQNNGQPKGTEPVVSEADMREAIKPLQVLIGSWRGVTSKAIAGARGIEEPIWQWDFSVKTQPALSFVSKTSSFLTKGRLTYSPTTKSFELAATDKTGIKRTYRGDFTEPVRDVAGDGNKLQRTFVLSLTQFQPTPKTREPLYKIDFQQQENNRYLMIVHRKAGTSVRPFDRVGNQRQGTSFALNLDDYGDRTCVVTQGLGTTTVSYKGKTYYVCCSGCRKTFEDDPEMWIASFEKWKIENGKK